MSQTADRIKQILLVAAEGAAREIVNQEFDGLVDKLVDKVKEAIPGTVDDVILDLLKSQFQEMLKQELLGLIDQIDGQEG